jgi:hypothetical protein
MMDRLKGVLRAIGYAGLVVVVDRVDEPTLVCGDPERMKALIWPMLSNKFLQQEGVGIKLLLPMELRHAVFRESSAFFQGARLDKQSLVEHLSWTGTMLYDLCEGRLRSCLRPGAKSIRLLDLFTEDVTQEELAGALELIAVAAPDFAQLVAKAVATLLVVFPDRVKQGQGTVEVPLLKTPQGPLLQFVFPALQLQPVRDGRCGRIDQLQLQTQGPAPALLQPQLPCLEPSAAGLLARGIAAEPAQGCQLFAVTQAGIDVAPIGGLLEACGQLALPDVDGPKTAQHQSKGEAQPETGQPVPAKGQDRGNSG